MAVEVGNPGELLQDGRQEPSLCGPRGWAGPGRERLGRGFGHPTTSSWGAVYPRQLCPFRSSTPLSCTDGAVTGQASPQPQFYPRGSATPKLTAILGITAFAPSRERSQLHCRHTGRGIGRMRRGIYRLLRAQGKASRLPWDAPGTGGSSGAPEVRDWELSRSLPPGLPGAPRLGSPRAQAWGALVR